MVFHAIDVYDAFPQYRLHTPDEITARNHASRFEVARDVLFEQVIQTIVAAGLSLSEPVQMTGMEDYDVAVWARRVRLPSAACPRCWALLGLNAAAISKNMAAQHPLLAGALAGGHYPSLTTSLAGGPDGARVPALRRLGAAGRPRPSTGPWCPPSRSGSPSSSSTPGSTSGTAPCTSTSGCTVRSHLSLPPFLPLGELR